MENQLIDCISYVKNSKYRYDILIALLENELLTPKEISKIVSLRLNHVSKTLSDLKGIDLVICVNEYSKRGRLYKITELGKKTIEWLKKHDQK